MMNKKGILILGILYISVILLLVPNLAFAYEEEGAVEADADTYVDSDEPLSNFGGQDELYVGVGLFSGIYEAFIYFDVSDIPDTVTKAELSLSFWGVDKTMDFDVGLIEEDWEEDKLDWMSKPSSTEKIDTITVRESDIYTVDVLDYIEGEEDFSVCINISNYIDDDYVYIYSREGYYSDEDAPMITYTYEEEIDAADILPTVIILVIIIGVGIGIAILILQVTKKTSPKTIPVSPIPAVYQQRSFNLPVPAGIEVRFCPNCGIKIATGAKFCDGCGTKLDGNYINGNKIR